MAKPLTLLTNSFTPKVLKKRTDKKPSVCYFVSAVFEISERICYDLVSQMKVKTTKKNLNLLLSGKHPQTKKYEGKHVMVVKDKVVPLKEGKESIEQFKKLEEKYNEAPTLVFVPRTDISYIL